MTAGPRRNDAPPPLPSAGAYAALERRYERQQWFVWAMAGLVAAAAFVGLRQDMALRSLTELLERRTPVIAHIEDSTAQQVCSDQIEAQWQTVIARVVLAAIDDDEEAMAEARPFLFTTIQRLQRVNELCPPPLPDEK